MTRLVFDSISESSPGPVWASLCARFWPGYTAWFQSAGASPPPSAPECRGALVRHMPELLATYDRLVALAGGGDTAARLLALWCPAPYMSGCSQAIWTRGPGPGPLIRSYEYSPDLFEGVVLRTQWTRPVLGMSDCLWGLLDGVNDAGLCVALAFGGRDVIGPGFGIPLVLRYLLETCTSTAAASATLARLPIHMAYNVAMVDAAGDYANAQVGPDRPALIRRDPVSTNHQVEEGHEGAPVSRQDRPPRGPVLAHETGRAGAAGTATFAARYAKATATHARDARLRQLLADPEQTPAGLANAFVRAPLYSGDYRRGFGTLYLASYNPVGRSVTLRWPGRSRLRQSLASFKPGQTVVTVP